MSAAQQSKQKTRGRPRQKTANTVDVKSQHLEWFVAEKAETDPCDCLYENCPGCWYPCEKCCSTKCSPFCRHTRKEAQWAQQHIEWKRAF